MRNPLDGRFVPRLCCLWGAAKRRFLLISQLADILLFPRAMFPVRLFRFALCLALLFALAQSARALQLGETRAQLVARHGPPGDEDHARNLATYFWDGWSAQLEFHGGTVKRITYKRDWYLKEEEIASLLEANGGAARWTELSGPNDKNRLWARDDGAAASCTGSRPLNIVFEAGPDSGNSPAGPKDAGPASQTAATNTTPKSPAQPAAAAEPAAVTTSLPPAPAPVVSEPTAQTLGEAKPIAERQSAAAATVPHQLSYALGAGVLLALAGIALYFLKRRPRPAAGGLPAAPETALPPVIADRLPELYKLSPEQLELLITAAFRREGYRVELSAAAGSDDGFALTLRRDVETVLLQFTREKYAQVAESKVREFHDAIAAGGASLGILMTTGEFTAEARRFAEDNGIELLDGMALGKRLAAGAAPAQSERQAVAVQ